MEIIKRDGSREAFDFNKIERLNDYATRGLNVDKALLKSQIKLLVYDGMSTREIFQAQISSADGLISEEHPDFTFVAARYLLADTLKRVTGSSSYPSISSTVVRGIEAGRYNPDLGSGGKFDHAALDAAIKPERDFQFDYLGLQTVVDRYLIRDTNGALIELPQHFFMRVAMGLSLNEDNPTQRAIEFYDALSSFDGMSSTPTLFNSATLHSQLSSCFPPDTEVMTSGGLRRIADIEVDDLVLTQGGSYERVLATRSKPAESGLVKVWVRGVMNGAEPVIEPTEDHLLYAIKDEVPGWYRADQLAVGDAVQIAFPTTERQITLSVIDSLRPGYLVSEGRVYKAKNDTKRGLIDEPGVQTSPVINQVDLNADFGRFMGYYLAEGHVTGERIVGFTFNTKETSYIADALALGESVFGLSGRVRHNLDGSSNVSFHSTILANFILSLTGTHFDRKVLPECFMSAPNEFARGLLVGVMRGDGCAIEYGFNLQMSNRGLMMQLFQLLLKIGYLPTIHAAHMGRLATAQPYTITLRYSDASDLIEEVGKNTARITKRTSDPRVAKRRFFLDGMAFYKVYALESKPFDGNVYDLQVENDPSFTAGLIVAHNCYLNTVNDQISADEDDVHRFASIYGTIEESARLSKFAGGIGTDWTRVRGSGSHIKSTNGQSSGVVPYLKVYNDTAVAVNQGGKRKGSFAPYLEPWHPDFWDFCELKKEFGDDRLRAHDIFPAAWISDLFMERVREKGIWSEFQPNLYPELHELYGEEFKQRYEQLEREGKAFKQRPAVEVWKRILTNLFETGHPWVTFKDECNRRSPQDHVGVVHSSNLCTEITLNTSDTETAVCNLASVNLARHIKDGKIDTQKLAKTVKTLMRMLDNVIDLNYYPSSRAKASNMKHRPVGLGIMGETEASVACGIAFDSEEGVQFSDEAMELVSYYAINASMELSRERGAYQTFPGSKWSRAILPIHTARSKESRLGEYVWDSLAQQVAVYGMRNSNTMAIAPTATISTITGTTPCNEPIFEISRGEKNMSGVFQVVDPCVRYGRPDLLKTAFEIDPIWVIRKGARRQKWLDQSQSLNIFVKAGTKGSQLAEIYMAAWEQGLKTTYYLRSQSKTKAVAPEVKQAVEAQGDLDKVVMGTNFCSIENPSCEACQ